jgi:hypothetical protein
LAAVGGASLVVLAAALHRPALRDSAAHHRAFAPIDSRGWQVFEHDFRGGHFDERQFQLIAPAGASGAISPQADGLRLRAPEGHAQPIGVATRFGVRGDFEITATFEVLPCPPPRSGFGLGAELLVKPFGDWDTLASMGRYRRSKDSIYAMAHFFQVDGQPRREGEFPATRASSASFRLARKGSLLLYLVADGVSDGYRELFRTQFGPQDVQLIRLAATPGGSPESVEVIWRRLSVKAQELIDPDGVEFHRASLDVKE